MTRMTLALDDAMAAALRDAAARTGKTVVQLVGEALASYGIKPKDDALDILRRAREQGGMEEDAALQFAVAEVRALRDERPAR